MIVATVREFGWLRRLDRRLCRTASVSEDVEEQLFERILDLQELAYRTPPIGLVGAAMKLRLLVDPSLGCLDNLDEAEACALRDIAEVIARELTQRA